MEPVGEESSILRAIPAFVPIALAPSAVATASAHGAEPSTALSRTNGLIEVGLANGRILRIGAEIDMVERGRFIWPKLENGAVTISPAQLGYMLEGIDWRAPQKTYRPQVAG